MAKLIIAAEGIKRDIPNSFGMFLNGITAEKLIEELQAALKKRPETFTPGDHFWLTVHLEGDPCIFNGGPIPWK